MSDNGLKNWDAIKPTFTDRHGDPVTITTKIADLQDGDREAMGYTEIKMPEFTDKNGDPVTINTKLSDLQEGDRVALGVDGGQSAETLDM